MDWKMVPTPPGEGTGSTRRPPRGGPECIAPDRPSPKSAVHAGVKYLIAVLRQSAVRYRVAVVDSRGPRLASRQAGGL